MIALSKASKMPCKSWSLMAVETCPGARAKDGGLVEVCQGCYATTGNYGFPNVKKPRIANREDWKRDGWVNDMVATLGAQHYFRWFDSGDIYDVRLASKILLVIKGTPNTKHWLPTRSYKFPRIRKVLAQIKRQPNATVRYSSDNIGSFNKALHGSVVFSGERHPFFTSLCEAYTRDGKCGDCRACWDKSIAVIAYPTHGVKMAGVVKRRAA